MDVDPILFPLVAAVTDGKRRKRDTEQAKQQFNMEELEAVAEERDNVSHAKDDTSRVVEEEEGAQSAMGSAYNPENPYHVSARFFFPDKQDCRVGAFLINYQEAHAETLSNPQNNITNWTFCFVNTFTDDFITALKQQLC